MTRRIKGREVCATVWDAWGRAHLLSPTAAGGRRTVCGRELEQAGKRSGKSCMACSEGAPAANRALRANALLWS